MGKTHTKRANFLNRKNERTRQKTGAKTGGIGYNGSGSPRGISPGAEGKRKAGNAMRCSCPHCETETWMIHSERDNACVCPECLYRCYACQGTGTALTREEILALRRESPREQAETLAENAAEDAARAVMKPDEPV